VSWGTDNDHPCLPEDLLTGLDLTDAEPNARPGRGAPLSSNLWRHRVQSTVLQSWWSANMQYSTNTRIEHVC